MDEETKEEVKKAKRLLQKKNDRLINALDGAEYQELVNTIKEAWTDENASKYLDKLQEGVNTCKRILTTNNNAIQSLIDSKIN